MSLNCMSGDGVTILNNIAELWAGAMWRACWQGTLLIAVIWATCRLLPRLSAATRYWLWWLACLKLCVGLLWATPVALPLLPAGTDLNSSVVAPQAVGQTAQVVVTALPDASSAETFGAQLVRLSPLCFLMLAWIGSIVLWLGIIVRQLLVMRRLIAQSQPVCDDTVQSRIALLRQQLSLHRFPPVATSDSIPSPLVVGPIRPIVVIPTGITQQLSASELEMALAHEFMHVRRGDLWWAQIPTLAQILFFFHPLAWLAHREWITSCEEACDADTLRWANASPSAYGEVLLKLVTSGRAPTVSIALGATRDYRMIESRIKGLRNYAPAAPARLRMGIVLLLLLGCAGVVPWRVTARTTAGVGNGPTAGYVTSANTYSTPPRRESSTPDSGRMIAVPRSGSTQGGPTGEPTAIKNATDGRIVPRPVSASIRSTASYRPAQPVINRLRNVANLARVRRPVMLSNASNIRRTSRSTYAEPVPAPRHDRTLSGSDLQEQSPVYVSEPLPTTETRSRDPIPTAPVDNKVPNLNMRNQAYRGTYANDSQPQQSTYRNAYQAQATNSGTYQVANSYRRPRETAPPTNTNAPVTHYPQEDQTPQGQQVRQPQPQTQRQQVQMSIAYGQASQIPPQTYGYAPADP